MLALLKAGADPNGSPYNNCSPVLTAAREGDVDVLRELLRFGAEVDVKPKVPEWATNATACRGPLYISAVYGHLDCFKLLLLHGANPNYNCTDEKMLARIKQPKTVVEMCLRYGCGVEYIQLLIDFGADVYLPTLIVDKSTKQNEALALLLKARGEMPNTVFFFYTNTKMRHGLKTVLLIHLLFVSTLVCPKTLMTQTRLSIRRYLRLPDKEAGIDSLDLPQMLRKYLKHSTAELL